MDMKQLFDGFEPAKYEAEAEQRWGDSDAFKDLVKPVISGERNSKIHRRKRLSVNVYENTPEGVECQLAARENRLVVLALAAAGASQARGRTVTWHPAFTTLPVTW